MYKLIAILLFSALLGSAAMLNVALVTPNAGHGEVVVEIKRGQSVRAIAKKLFDSGVIGSPFLFEMEARFLRSSGGPLQAGEFSLKRNLSIREVVSKLVEGKTMLHSVTIAEGLTVLQIAAQMEKAKIVTADDFLKAVTAEAMDKKWRMTHGSLEGYLFPETYKFPKNTPAAKVVTVMTEMFFKQARKMLPEPVVSTPETLHKIVTLASIIEKETGAKNERSLISAVFINRLKRNMPLQSDPTVIYALPHFDGNLKKKDLKYDSPYNTYMNRGLPPGPIANPGRASLNAAYRPARVDYLYFVSKNNGEHHFSKTLNEHNRAVRQYQINHRGD